MADDCENLELPGFNARLITREGRPAPGLNATLVSLLAEPRINNNKQVAFWADTSGPTALYVWSDGTAELRVAETQPAPGTNELFSNIQKPIAFNDSGELAFSAALTGGVPRGIFLSTPQDLIPVVLHGDPVPGLGGTFDLGSVPGALTNAGELYFRVLVVGGSGLGENGAIFRYHHGVISAVVASGETYPDIGFIEAVLDDA
ncbi:MAG: hypothetical protein GY778_25035 [bacterium]|nr:hypothetical protein [bacterium]